MAAHRSWIPIAAVALLLCACGSATTSSEGSAAPPALSQSSALTIAKAFFAADNQAQQNLDTSKISQLEEGPEAIIDQAEYPTYLGHQKSLPAYTATQVAVVVPAHAATFPETFIAEATLNTSSAGDHWLFLFLRDTAASPWRVSLEIDAAQSAYPQFALDAQGFGNQLDAADQGQLQASAIEVADAFANYVSVPLFHMQAASAPNLTFTAGANTSGYLGPLQSLFSQATQSGGSTRGSIQPDQGAWAYGLQGGGAAVFFDEQSNYIVQMGGTAEVQLSQGIDSSVDPGTYTGVTEMAENMGVAIVPAKGGGASISVPFAT
ncbi:MAG: hypothetical protein JOY80_05455, partial [Candidatus Dormibacteraeota bacterium]|nr:hypothetical protein [Candidatus Dormibacteraeota bacterium]